MSSTSYPLDPLDSQLKFEWSNQTESLENLFKIFQEPFQSPVPIPRELITPVKRNQQETESKPLPQPDQNKQFYTQQSPIYSPNSSHLQNQNKVSETPHLVLPLEKTEDLHKSSPAHTQQNYSSQLVNDPNYINYAQEYINHSQQRNNMNSNPPSSYNSQISLATSAPSYTSHPPAQHFNSQYVSSQQLNQLHNRFQNGTSQATGPQSNNNYNSPTGAPANNYATPNPNPVYSQTQNTPSYNPPPSSNQYSQQDYHPNPSTHSTVQNYRDSPPVVSQQYPSPQQQEFQQSTTHPNYPQSQSQNTNKYQRSEPEYHARVQSSSQSQSNVDYSDYNHSIHQAATPIDYQTRSQQQHQQTHQSQSQQQPQQSHQQLPTQQPHLQPIHSSQNRSPPQLQPQLQPQQTQNQSNSNNYNLTYIDSNAKEFTMPTVAPENKNLSIVPATILNGNSDAQYCDITEYLNYPQIEAARKLHLPPSTLSKRWKEAAPNRKWPWRTVCKLDKEISTLLHNIPPDGTIPKQIEGKLAVLIQQRQEELKPIVIRL